ncbi:hypothetical protein RhiJN_02793 [Ceratobasidium sp. AG-Ba]|nr:hypothetical protein RhiJN_02793 [Ceratobasidium sp. AG-Ba]
MYFRGSALENQLIEAVLAKADPESQCVVTADYAVNIFESSGLPKTTLGQIWELADPENNGFLTDTGVGVALRLIGWAQAGEKPREDLAQRAGPLPTLGSISVLALVLPKRAHQRIPQRSSRNLADTQARGFLDETDFIIGMFFIQAAMSGTLQIMPTSLPPGLYEQASGSTSRPFVEPLYTGSSSSSTSIFGFRSIAQSPTVSQAFASPEWAVSNDTKARSDSFFTRLDVQRRGWINNEVAATFMAQSQLPAPVLGRIWDLADVKKDGKLTADEFAVAMHLIDGKLAGREIPVELPASLVPPSLRTGTLATASTRSQDDVPKGSWSSDDTFQTVRWNPNETAFPSAPPTSARQNADLSKSQEELRRAENQLNTVRREREKIERELQDVQSKTQIVTEEIGETKAEIERFKHGTMLVNEELVVARRQLVNGESDRIQVLVDMNNAKKEFENAQGELESTNRKIAAKVLHRSTISTRPSTLPLGTTLASQLNMLLSGSDNIVQRRLVSDDRNCDHLSQGEKNPVGDSETEEGDAGPQTQNAGRGSLDFAAELLNIGSGDNVANYSDRSGNQGIRWNVKDADLLTCPD